MVEVWDGSASDIGPKTHRSQNIHYFQTSTNIGSQSPRANDQVGADAGIQKLTLTKIPRGVHVIKESHDGRLADSSGRIGLRLPGLRAYLISK